MFAVFSFFKAVLNISGALNRATALIHAFCAEGDKFVEAVKAVNNGPVPEPAIALSGPVVVAESPPAIPAAVPAALPAPIPAGPEPAEAPPRARKGVFGRSRKAKEKVKAKGSGRPAVLNGRGHR